MTTGLHIEVSRSETVSTVALWGELDLAVIAAARAEIDQALAVGPHTLVLDLRRLTFMDSSGVHLLTATSRRCEREERRFCVIDGSPQVHRLLMTCGLHNYFPVLSGLDELAFNQPALG